MTIGTLHFKFAHSSQKCSHQGPSCLCVHLIASVEHEAFQIERYGSQIVRRVADVGTLAVKRGHQAQMGHIRGGRGGGGGKVGDDKTRVSLKKIRYGLGFFFIVIWRQKIRSTVVLEKNRLYWPSLQWFLFQRIFSQILFLKFFTLLSSFECSLKWNDVNNQLNLMSLTEKWH